MNKSVLPALSVALGLPLCHHNVHNKNESSRLTTLASSSSTSATKSSSSSAVDNGTTSTYDMENSHAKRVRNNVARIYARRMMDRCQLERQHPYYSSSDENCCSNTLSTTSSRSDNSISSDSNVNPSQNDSIEEALRSKLLSETLLSLIEMKEKLNRVKSMHNNYYYHHVNTLTTTAVAACESSSSSSSTTGAGFRDRYNAIDAATSNNNTDATSTNAAALSTSKPAEWGDDTIDLAQRRLQFGQEISPLSNTTRLQRWGMAVKRMITLGTLVAPLGVMIPANVVLGSLAGKPTITEEEEEGDGNDDDEGVINQKKLPMLQRYHQKLTQSTWDYALWAIESAGPTYIKLVQWASTRNDLFSPEFVGHFSKLQDETRGHAWRETEHALERAYGKEWKKILSFDRVIEDDDDESDGIEGGRLKRTGGAANRDRQKRLERQETKSNNSSSLPTIPIGSGCVAQVYKARLRSSHGLHQAGTSVAVKVQHPRILEKVCLDFYLLNKFASFLEYIPYLNLDYLSMKDSVDQFRDIMLPQLDLRVEAHNLQRFRRDFEGESQIAFPEPLVELTSREVLVEKFVEGEPMLNFVLREDENHSKKDREELARIGLETVMKMIFLHDFIHADLVSKIACSLFVDMLQVFTTLAINSHHACLLAHVLPSQ